MLQLERELAVVGEQERAARVVVEPPDRNDTRADAADQVLDRLAPLGITQRAHDAARLVQDVINERLGHDPPAIDLDTLPARISAYAELANYLAVDADSPFDDQLFGSAT